jgi:RHS repeat-associated protein
VGNVTSIADGLTPSASRSFTYQDHQYFLTQASGPWPALVWTYDKIGDRLTETQTGEPLPFTYTYSGTTPKLLQIQPRPHGNGSGSVTYGYDAAGNETTMVSSGQEGSGETTTLIYSNENKLSQLAISPGVAGTALLYDGRGFLRDAFLTYSGSSDFEHTEPTYGSEGLLYSRRWRRQSTYGTPQDNAPAPTITDDQTTHVFYFAGRPVAQWSTAGGLTYLTTDHLGTPVLATDTSGTTIWQGGFTPFGAPYQLMGPSLFLRLPGQWVDSSWSGYGEELYYNVNRWHEPQTGQYISPDPLGAFFDLNPYSYALDNPFVFTDPLGLLATVNCVRCRGTGGPMSCEVTELFPGFMFPTISRWPAFNTNTGNNAASNTPGDPFGSSGPLPPGSYDLPNAHSPRFRRDLPSPTNVGRPGEVQTSQGTNRAGIRIHRGTRSEGCVTTGAGTAGADLERSLRELVDRHQPLGGTTISIVEINCGCFICP